MTLKTDYLIKGCGASAMAFVDVLLQETDATFTLVDKRDLPGGHWNDAYSFVRLHQPSASYGVPSRQLGHNRIDKSGLNEGMYELASGFEVADYYHQLMSDTFLPTGRVRYFPVSEIIENADGKAQIRNLLSGAITDVEFENKLVDATLLQTSIPLTHSRNFTVDEKVCCVPPNDLTRLAPKYKHYAILGGGKTAIDVALWLLSKGANPDSIIWVRPRDAWLFNRANFQPGEECFEAGIDAMANQFEACAEAKDTADLCKKMEAKKVWLRIDNSVDPEMIHGATVTELEIKKLQQIKQVIRFGHVKAITKEKLVLEKGEVNINADTLYIDCTARALAGSLNSNKKIFDDKVINLQMVRQLQPTFSAALIAYVEAVIENEGEKQTLTQVTPMTDTVKDWMAMMVISMSNQQQWMNNSKIAKWIIQCRLDLFGKHVVRISETDESKRKIMAKIQSSAGPAVKNLARLASS